MRIIFIPTPPAYIPAGVANLPIIKDPCKTQVSKSVPSGIQYNITDTATEIYLLFNISHYYHHDSMRAKCARHFLKLLLSYHYYNTVRYPTSDGLYKIIYQKY